ncbi:unnamed protein product, partial [marine sediment metagenome]
FKVIGIVCASKGSKLIAKAIEYPTRIHCFEFVRGTLIIYRQVQLTIEVRAH